LTLSRPPCVFIIHFILVAYLLHKPFTTVITKNGYNEQILLAMSETCLFWGLTKYFYVLCSDNLSLTNQDGFVLVGSVAGQRYWSTLLPADVNNITSGVWTPDDQHVYLGTSQVKFKLRCHKQLLQWLYFCIGSLSILSK